jgi:hypothetical protein
VIGWAVDEHMRTNLVESAVAMAVAMRGELVEAVILQPTVAVSTPPGSWPGSLNSTEVPMGDTITPAQALAEARDDISAARHARRRRRRPPPRPIRPQRNRFRGHHAARSGRQRP